MQRQGAPAAGRAADRATGTAPGEPEDEATARDHPHPARRELTVEAAHLAEVEVSVELVDPGAQRQRARRTVLFEGAAHLPVVRVHEHRERVVGVDSGDTGEHDSCRRPGFRGRPYGADVSFGMGLAGGGDLIGDRQLGLAHGNVQLMGVHDLLGLERARIEQARDRGDEQERGDEHPCVEVQSQDQPAQRGPGRPAGGRRRRCVPALFRKARFRGVGGFGGEGQRGPPVSGSTESGRGPLGPGHIRIRCVAWGLDRAGPLGVCARPDARGCGAASGESAVVRRQRPLRAGPWR